MLARTRLLISHGSQTTSGMAPWGCVLRKIPDSILNLPLHSNSSAARSLFVVLMSNSVVFFPTVGPQTFLKEEISTLSYTRSTSWDRHATFLHGEVCAHGISMGAAEEGPKDSCLLYPETSSYLLRSAGGVAGRGSSWHPSGPLPYLLSCFKAFSRQNGQQERE